MQTRSTFTLVILMSMIIGFAAFSGATTTAQSPLDDYDPPLGSPEDNECNEGGQMYGQCLNEQHWICGWHLARAVRNIIDWGQIPDFCDIDRGPEALPNRRNEPEPCLDDFKIDQTSCDTIDTDFTTDLEA